MRSLILLAIVFLCATTGVILLLYVISLIRKARPSERTHMDPLPRLLRIVWPAVNILQFHISEMAPTAMVAIPAVAFIVAMTYLRIASSAIQSSFYVVYLEHLGLNGVVIGTLIGIGEGFGMFGAGIAGWLEKRLKPHWTLILFVILSLLSVCVTPLIGGTSPVSLGLSRLNHCRLVTWMARAPMNQRR